MPRKICCRKTSIELIQLHGSVHYDHGAKAPLESNGELSLIIHVRRKHDHSCSCIRRCNEKHN